MKIVTTELSLITRLFNAGFLSSFTPKDVQFYIVDYCFRNQAQRERFDSINAQKMLLQGMLVVAAISEEENENAANLFLNHTNFLFESIVSVMYAKQKGFNFFTEDPSLMSFAFDYCKDEIEIHSKGLLITSLIYKLGIGDHKFDRRVLMAI